MFCIGCGHKIAAAGKFCPQCGTPVPADASEPAAPAPRVEATPPQEQAASRATAEAPSAEHAKPNPSTGATHANANNGGAENANFGSQPRGQSSTIIIVSQVKSLPLAIILALCFGPLGLLYSTVKGAVIMFFVNIVVGLLTLGFGLLITFPLGAVWAAMATNAHNAALLAGAQRQ